MILLCFILRRYKETLARHILQFKNYSIQSNQIENEEWTIQWPNETRQKDNNCQNTGLKTKDRATRTASKPGGEQRFV